MKVMFIICVVYNKNIYDITSMDNFRKLHDQIGTQLIVVDNSDNDIILNNNLLTKHQLEDETNDFIIYLGGMGNVGLSKAYNFALDYIKSKFDSFIVMISDDDTLFSCDYLHNAFECMQQGDYHLASGLIKNDKKIYSPVKKAAIYNFKSNFVTEPGIYRNIYCINSGLLLDSFICNNLRFNEKIFLMMGDYWLMDYLSSKGLNIIKIVDGDIQQEFSVFQNDKVASLKRYKLFKKDFLVYCKSTKKSLFYKCAILIKRRLHIMLMHK